MELDTPAPAPAPVSVPAPAPPASPSPAVQAMRKNFKMAAISQFVNLFKHHIALDFSIEVRVHPPSQSGRETFSETHAFAGP